jgi:hypothetical protein
MHEFLVFFAPYLKMLGIITAIFLTVKMTKKM